MNKTRLPYTNNQGQTNSRWDMFEDKGEQQDVCKYEPVEAWFISLWGKWGQRCLKKEFNSSNNDFHYESR